MFDKIKKNFFLFTSFLLILYFLISLLGGERGLFSNLKKRNHLESLKTKESQLISSIKILETKNSLLTENLDLDYLDYLIRDKFFLGKKKETTYIINNDEN